MTPEKSAEAKILLDHLGQRIDLGGGVILAVRPFNVEELLDEQIVEDLLAIGKAIWSQIGALFKPDKSPEEITDGLDKLDLLAVFKAAKEPAKRCLTRCCDRPLKEIPAAALPQVLEALILVNFPQHQLTHWAGLMKTMLSMLKAATQNTTTSATSARSLSTTGTNSGGSTRPPSSSTGTGAA